MRAAVYDHEGPAREVLRVTDVERPEPGPGQVRVKVAVSAINPTDYKSRAGLTSRPIDGFQIPHHDGAGVIDAVGEGVGEARIGQRVWMWMAAFQNRYGTAAEWTVVPADQAVPLPEAASFDLGACLGVPAVTAHRCLFSGGPLDGRTVLVAGGAGAVGHYSIELAKRAGARVITTVSGPEKAALAAKAGADHVVNYRELSATQQVKALAPRVDRIIEVALGANLAMDLAVADSDTTVVVYAAEPDDPVLPVRACMTANVTMAFVLLYSVPRPALEQAATDITAALTDGALSELPLHRYPLEEIATAHEAAESGINGKILITL